MIRCDVPLSSLIMSKALATASGRPVVGLEVSALPGVLLRRLDGLHTARLARLCTPRSPPCSKEEKKKERPRRGN